MRWTAPRQTPALAKSANGCASTRTALSGWLSENVEGFRGPIAVSQFKGGQSNPTYRIDSGGRAFVLRRKPPGKVLPGAHAVDREYRVLAALGAQGFPVPRVYALCEDESVIGTPFYVMDMVPGRIVWEAHFPDIESRGARCPLRRDERDDRLASQLRSGGDRPWRLWQSDRVCRAPGRALVEAISGRHGWRPGAGDGPAGRVARHAPAARQRALQRRPRRLPLRQYDLRR